MGKSGPPRGEKFDTPQEYHNARLWKRKQYKKTVNKNERGKMFRDYHRIEGKTDDNPETTDKQNDFYKELFTKNADDVPIVKKKKNKKAKVAVEQKEETKEEKPKSGFSGKLESIAKQREERLKAEADKKQKLETKLRQKSRYSKQLNRRNSKGQPKMTAMIGHYLNKISK